MALAVYARDALAQHRAYPLSDEYMGLAVARLSTVFVHYDRQHIAHVLWATIKLFRWLAVETAKRWQYAYPAANDQAVTGVVRQLLAGMSQREPLYLRRKQ